MKVTRAEFNNYHDEALPYNQEKIHVISVHATRSEIDSAVSSRRQATSNHQN